MWDVDSQGSRAGFWRRAFVWFLWIIVDVVRKRDPIYDRIAGTAVVPA
jgi:hypothetical protein